jgi:protoporphyrinogen oxidase
MEKIAIIGAGPAGLTAAYLLGKAKKEVTVFEKNATYVGGISRTECYNGYYFDIGGHRFLSKSKEIEDFWTEMLGDQLLERSRKSRIFYNRKFFSYPLVAIEALTKLGVLESFLCALSYLKAKILPVKNPRNFEDWVSNQFGKRLFNIFFKTYTEKVWGIPCNQISADWAAQRIKGLSLSRAVWNALFKTGVKNSNGIVIKTLIDSFRYPKLGPGMMWEECAKKSKALGARIEMAAVVNKIEKLADKWNVYTTNGKIYEGFDYLLSSAPIGELIPAVVPSFSRESLQSASQLKYRDFLTIVLICKDENAFSDNWIYVHDPEVKVGRIQNFKSWSPYMVPDPKMACYGLEYFCFEGDGLWSSPDNELIALGTREICKIGLTKPESIIDGHVVRQQKAYPVYDHDYKDHLSVIRAEIKKRYKGLCLLGRNGMHKYNNQDHSMMSAMLAVKNILYGNEVYDLWNINEDAEYHEGGNRGVESGLQMRSVPEQIRAGKNTQGLH